MKIPVATLGDTFAKKTVFNFVFKLLPSPGAWRLIAIARGLYFVSHDAPPFFLKFDFFADDRIFLNGLLSALEGLHFSVKRKKRSAKKFKFNRAPPRCHREVTYLKPSKTRFRLCFTTILIRCHTPQGGLGVILKLHVAQFLIGHRFYPRPWGVFFCSQHTLGAL